MEWIYNLICEHWFISSLVVGFILGSLSHYGKRLELRQDVEIGTRKAFLNKEDK